MMHGQWACSIKMHAYKWQVLDPIREVLSFKSELMSGCSSVWSVKLKGLNFCHTDLNWHPFSGIGTRTKV